MIKLPVEFQEYLDFAFPGSQTPLLPTVASPSTLCGAGHGAANPA